MLLRIGYYLVAETTHACSVWLLDDFQTVYPTIKHMARRIRLLDGVSDELFILNTRRRGWALGHVVLRCDSRNAVSAGKIRVGGVAIHRAARTARVPTHSEGVWCC